MTKRGLFFLLLAIVGAVALGFLDTCERNSCEGRGGQFVQADRHGVCVKAVDGKVVPI